MSSCLRCTEVSQQSAGLGQSGHFGDVGAMSVMPPIATNVLHCGK
jgi:hypothetical protein